MRKYFYAIVAVVLGFSTTGCALSTGIRFGDDGSVSKPEVHGSVNASGSRSF